MKLGVAGRAIAAVAWLAPVIDLVAERSTRARAARATGLVLLALASTSCCRDQSCSGSKPPAPNDDDPVFTMTPAEQRQACEAAGKKLAELNCKQARPDFGAFCVNAIEAKVPIRPLCLASMSDCSEVDGRCRTGKIQDGGTP